jgi:hypothetical protein
MIQKKKACCLQEAQKPPLLPQKCHISSTISLIYLDAIAKPFVIPESEA